MYVNFELGGTQLHVSREPCQKRPQVKSNFRAYKEPSPLLEGPVMCACISDIAYFSWEIRAWRNSPVTQALNLSVKIAYSWHLHLPTRVPFEAPFTQDARHLATDAIHIMGYIVANRSVYTNRKYITSKDLGANVQANLLPHPVWTGPQRLPSCPM